MSILSTFRNTFSNLFTSTDPKNIGIYGPSNAGKSTLTNRIINDWSPEQTEETDGDSDEFVSESEIPHETRRAERSDTIVIENESSEISINVVDTPGVETKVSAEELGEYGLDEEDATTRSREATEGIAEAMHWLREDIDGVIYMMDSTKDPFTQVNTMVIGIIESQDLPVVILANKTDLPDAQVNRIKNAFPQHPVIPVSALEGHNIDTAYDTFTEEFN